MDEHSPYRPPGTTPVTSSAENAPISGGPGPFGPFRETRGLCATVVTMLVIEMALSLIWGGLVGYEYHLLNAHGDEYFYADGEVRLAMPHLTMLYGLVGVLMTLVYIVTVVLFCVWINKTCKNAWFLNPQGMQIRPGWAVGWYFIPIANLFKPYQSMKEIGVASCGPGGLKGLLPLWWAFWIISNAANNVATRLSLRAETPDEAETAAVVDLITTPFNAISAIAAVLVVRTVTRGQFQHLGPA